MSKQVKHFVEFLCPGVFWSDTIVEEVAERNPKNVIIPYNSFGFRFFDRTMITVDGENLEGNRKNFTGWFYKGKKLTLEQIERDYSSHQILIDNMKRNGYNAVVLTKFYQFIPLGEKDTILT